ncbi:hypothetical protein [Homoserinibacter sp. GY 40078]|uniref:hypothetical protein n=1 Tax=Homoserinibacter sp. GY 40078 TaxID=2603275 RepID=UPI0011CCDEB7|nr:hypothetical protein [Homoserinibacter sp. GY 40078]TXK18754.1 hypothetical protein FVQ89_02090 [Homoserinibacter sp. GY 40078]
MTKGWINAEEAAAARAEHYALVTEPMRADLARIGVEVERLSEVDPANAEAMRIIRDRYADVQSDLEAAMDATYLFGDARAQPAGGRWLVYEGFPLLERILPPPDLDAAVLLDMRYFIGDALRRNRDPELFDGLHEIARRSELGLVRVGYVSALASHKSRAQELVPVMTELLDDDEMWPTTALAVARLRLTELRPRIQQRVEEAPGWKRSYGKRALKSLDRPPRT